MPTLGKSSIDNIDFKFRVYLLGLCDGRELTANDIRKAIRRDYTEKEFTRQRIDGLLKQFVKYHFLSRNKVEPSEEDQCRYSYTTTKRGRERAKYYKAKMQENNR